MLSCDKGNVVAYHANVAHDFSSSFYIGLLVLNRKRDILFYDSNNSHLSHAGVPFMVYSNAFFFVYLTGTFRYIYFLI